MKKMRSVVLCVHIEEHLCDVRMVCKVFVSALQNDSVFSLEWRNSATQK